jgi:hypothetical protein
VAQVANRKLKDGPYLEAPPGYRCWHTLGNPSQSPSKE